MSAEKILEKIDESAAAQIAAIRAQTAEKASALEKSILAKADADAQVILAAAESDAAEILRRSQLMAGLATRKNSLAAKRAVMDQAFEQAKQELCRLEPQRFESLIIRVVLKAAPTGNERLRIPKKDLPTYQNGLLSKISRAFEEETGRTAAFSIDPTPATFTDGIQLIGEKSDINGSFDVLLRDVREQSERKTATILFGMEV